jgi:hypothetical protein
VYCLPAMHRAPAPSCLAPHLRRLGVGGSLRHRSRLPTSRRLIACKTMETDEHYTLDEALEELGGRGRPPQLTVLGPLFVAGLTWMGDAMEVCKLGWYHRSQWCRRICCPATRMRMGINAMHQPSVTQPRQLPCLQIMILSYVGPAVCAPHVSRASCSSMHTAASHR